MEAEASPTEKVTIVTRGRWGDETEREAMPVPETEGWFVWSIKDTSDRMVFRYTDTTGREFPLLAIVHQPRVSHDGTVDGPACTVEMNTVSYQTRVQMSPAETRAWLATMAQAVALQAEWLDEYTEKVAEILEQRQREAKEREAREQAAREEREKARREEAERQAALEAPRKAWRAAMQETLQWHVGDWVRLLRWGKKATVFGHIDNVHLNEPDLTDENYRAWMRKPSHYIELTTEKGKYMRLTFDDIERMQLRNEEDKSYGDLNLPDHPEHDSPQRRQRREIAGGKGMRMETGE